MALHKLKTWPKYFRDVVDGNKNFELRKNDRDFRVGDKLLLQEYDPLAVSKENAYTGKKQKVKVTYIVSGDDDGYRFGLQPGYVCLGVEKV